MRRAVAPLAAVLLLAADPADPALDRAEQRAQLRVLLPALQSAPFDRAVLREWSAWDVEHDLLERPVDGSAAFYSP